LVGTPRKNLINESYGGSSYPDLVNDIDDGSDLAGGRAILNDSNATNLNEFLERLKIWKFILALRNYKPGKEKQTLS
jgi:hypothetical protein